MHVAASRVTDARFDVRVGRAALRLLRPGGAPAAGGQLNVHRDGEPFSALAAVTDTEGRTTIVGTPGSVAATLSPRSPTAQKRAPISLPPLGLTEGEPPETEVRLPVEWDR